MVFDMSHTEKNRKKCIKCRKYIFSKSFIFKIYFTYILYIYIYICQNISDIYLTYTWHIFKWCWNIFSSPKVVYVAYIFHFHGGYLSDNDWQQCNRKLRYSMHVARCFDDFFLSTCLVTWHLCLNYSRGYPGRNISQNFFKNFLRFSVGFGTLMRKWEIFPKHYFLQLFGISPQFFF